MRDLEADLERCNAATPGPWVYDKNDVDIWSQPDPWRVCSVGLYADMVFIAEAREGWPHAIERAIKAEAEVERLNVIKNETPIDCDKVCVAYKYRVDENERLQTEVALLRKVEEVGEILWSEAICHRCEARECRGCSAHDFKKALSEYQSWKKGQK